MIEQLKALEDYLVTNKMQDTLKSLRAQILSKYPQAPSNQFMSLFEQQPQNKKNIGKNIQLTNQNSGRKAKVQDKMNSELIVEGLLGKIAYSSKLLQDQSVNMKISKLMGNKIFEKCLVQMFPETAPKINSNIQYIQSSFEYKDQLDLIEAVSVQNNLNTNNGQLMMGGSNVGNQNFNNTNILSNIQIQHQQHEESSIVSQPSMLLQQLNKNNQCEQDEYVDDNDLGFYQFIFSEKQLRNGCSKITQKYGYPQKAIKKNTKQQIKTQIGIAGQNIHKNNQYNKIAKNKSSGTSKFPAGVKFPSSNDHTYPREYNGIIYDVLKLKVIFDRQKTGYQQSSQLTFQQGKDVLAGRYRVDGVLGSGVFAKVLKVYDLLKKQQTCLKMVSNNKDFFDQALDQVKILRYINANCNPDEHNLLKFKGVFYHRQHLFIQTDLLKDNLYVAYRKNPAFFSIPILKQIAKQILQALSALHKLHIMHADLKPQNILIKSYNPIKIKVVDLGNSCFFHDILGQYVQSRSYRAPQVILGTGYDEKIDIWSVGCIISELWTKSVLFYNTCIQGMLARIQSIVGPWPEWMLDKGNAVEKYFSKQNLIFFQDEDTNKYHILIPKQTSLRARVRSDDSYFLSFLQTTLKIDPNFRLSADQALEHPFVKGI